MVKSGASYHTLGTLAADASFTSWQAPNCVQWTLNAGQFDVTTLDKPVSFVGLPSSSKASRFTGSNGLRFGGAASVVRNGVHLQTAIVAFSDMKNDTDATSVVLYSSDDGFSYTYLSTIASAADNPWSDEGPNEHAMELLADGSLLVVFRIDCGDGPKLPSVCAVLADAFARRRQVVGRAGAVARRAGLRVPAPAPPRERPASPIGRALALRRHQRQRPVGVVGGRRRGVGASCHLGGAQRARACRHAGV